jgi:hypothetical protein
LLYEVHCSSNNKDYVSQLNLSDLSIIFSNVDKWLVWPLLDWISTPATQLLRPAISTPELSPSPQSYNQMPDTQNVML